MKLMVFGPPHNMRRRQDLENTFHDVFWPTDLDGFFDLAKNLISPGVHVHVYCSALQYPSWW